MRKFKTGVSDWVLELDDLHIILDSVVEETVAMKADGRISIHIEEASMRLELWDKLKRGAIFPRVQQSFSLRDANGLPIEEVVYEYPFMEIDKIEMISTIHTVCIFNLFLVSE